MIIIDQTTVILTVIVLFLFNFIWHNLIFGKILSKINGFYELSASEKKSMSKRMIFWYILQLLLTIATVLAISVIAFKMSSIIFVIPAVLFLWLGFIMPFQMSIIIYSGLSNKNILIKSAITLSASLLSVIIAIFILAIF